MGKVFTWNEMYSVKVGSLDRQHRKLFALADRLHEALGTGQARVVDAILKQLVDYTMTHFAAEEALLRMHGYPQLAAHVAQHQQLRARVEVLQQQYAAGDRDVPGTLMMFLLNWLKGHILRDDQGYGEFLKARGIR